MYLVGRNGSSLYFAFAKFNYREKKILKYYLKIHISKFQIFSYANVLVSTVQNCPIDANCPANAKGAKLSEF